jgi:hypothetical protein
MAGEEQRISEFARRAGVSVRTVRFYHQAGVLQRPTVRGRVGYYGPQHVARLDLVLRLRARGYSLSAIADGVASQVHAVVVGEVPVPDPVTADWDAGDPSTLTRDQLHRMVPAVARAPHLVELLVDAELITPDGDDRFAVPEPPLLRAGIILVSRGLPVEVALAELARMRTVLGAIGERFARIVERDVLPAQPDPQRSAEAVLDEIWPAVLVAVGRVLTDAARDALAHPRPEEASGSP